MTSIPFVPFDPTETGPTDLVRQKWAGLKGFCSEHAIVLIPTSAILLIAAVYFGVSIPEIPNWGMVALVVTIIALPYAGFLGRALARGLYNRDVEVLSIQNPASGDQRLLAVQPDRFDDLRVVNHQGKERGRDFLKRVRVNGVLAYEVDDYHEGGNVAVASWQAGESNSEIRRQKVTIRYIKTELEKEADKALELLANHPNILRQHAAEVANRLVKVAEGIEVPAGGELHETLGDTIEENDPSEDLLGSGDDDDGQDDELGEQDDMTVGDIFDRAERLERGESVEAVADGGQDGE